MNEYQESAAVMKERQYDLLTIGRSSIDLYSNDIGARFEDITAFAALVGGCPTNVAVGTKRLGLNSVLLTAVGNDPVGDFVLSFLMKEGVDTTFIARKAGHRTSAVLLGIEPPDRFPLVFYRDNCADIELTIDDVENAPIAQCRALLVSGTGLSREPSRSATFRAVEIARQNNTAVFVDLDFRPDQWSNYPGGDVRAYGITMRHLIPFVDIVIGTEDEVKAVYIKSKDDVTVISSQVSGATICGEAENAVQQLLASSLKAVALKRGKSGSTVYLPGGKSFAAQPFPVEAMNVLGAGDAFASGFIYGYLKGKDWKDCAALGNAAGAIVVTRQGCANAMPRESELLSFMNQHYELRTKESSCRT
ncbi:MAG TPA: 5-dehydro-2-deoxygluconokinase [Candidatus Obscuribacterales bacterium]